MTKRALTMQTKPDPKLAMPPIVKGKVENVWYQEVRNTRSPPVLVLAIAAILILSKRNRTEYDVVWKDDKL